MLQAGLIAKVVEVKEEQGMTVFELTTSERLISQYDWLITLCFWLPILSTLLTQTSLIVILFFDLMEENDISNIEAILYTQDIFMTLPLILLVNIMNMKGLIPGIFSKLLFSSICLYLSTNAIGDDDEQFPILFKSLLVLE